jgi:hypothetical protein
MLFSSHEARDKEKIGKIVDMLQENVFFQSLYGCRANVDAAVACWATAQAFGAEVTEHPAEGHARMHEQSACSHASRSHDPALSATSNNPLRATGSYINILQRPLINVAQDRGTLVAEIHARNMLSSLIRKTQLDVLLHAVEENQDAILSEES